MTSDGSGLRTISTILAVLLAIPLFIMGVLMPLMALAYGSQTMGGVGGFHMIMPIVPLTILGVLAYVLYAYAGGSDERNQKTDSTLAELRSAYARGDLSDDEFEDRRDRLQSQPSVADEVEVSEHE